MIFFAQKTLNKLYVVVVGSSCDRSFEFYHLVVRSNSILVVVMI